VISGYKCSPGRHYFHLQGRKCRQYFLQATATTYHTKGAITLKTNYYVKDVKLGNGGPICEHNCGPLARKLGLELTDTSR
jgi:hypothetical protein